MDHGHSAGQDHFVLVIIWLGFDSDNNPTYIYCCPIIDLTGHSEEEVEQAVKNVLKQTLGDDVEVFCATADAGGNETTRLTPTLSNSQTIIVWRLNWVFITPCLAITSKAALDFMWDFSEAITAKGSGRWSLWNRARSGAQTAQTTMAIPSATGKSSTVAVATLLWLPWWRKPC